MESINLVSKEGILYLAIFGAGIGLVLGLIDLWIASKRGKKNLGYIAVAVCTILGALIPLLAIIAFVIFLVLILRSPAVKPPPVEVTAANQNPIDVFVSEPKDS